MSRETGTLAAVISGSVAVFLDTTVVNVALERIGSDLPATVVGVLEGQAYVINAYYLALASVLILAGALADRYGRRRMFLIGLIGFAGSSALCGLAPSMELLVAFRLLQGATGAFLVPTSLAILAATFHGPAAGRAYGIWAAVSSASFVAGPTIGGLLVDGVGWRAVFWINLPVAVVAGVLAVRYVLESRDEHGTRPFDVLGALAVALAVGGLAYGVIRGQQSGWSDASALWSLAVGAVTTVSLVPLMLLRPHPLIPPALFRSRNFTTVNLATLLIYGSMASYATVQALYLQGTLGYTALAVGLTSFPAGILLALGSTPVGALAGRLGPRWFMVVGPMLMGLAFAWLARIPETSPAWQAAATDPASLLPPAQYLADVLPSLLLYGVGLALMVAPLTQALMASIEPRNAGLGSAINNALSRIGPLLAVAVVFVAVSATFAGGMVQRGIHRELSQSIPPFTGDLPADLHGPSYAVEAVQAGMRGASTEAFHAAMWISAGLCLAGAVVSGMGIRHQPYRPSGDEATGADVVGG